MRLPFGRQAPDDASPVGAEAPAQASVAERRPEGGLARARTAADDRARRADRRPDHLREQIIGWIRAELLVNRERTGRLTDLRR